MDGIHDLGGMRGFGAVAKEVDEPTFHERWEAVALALNFLAISVLKSNNIDEYRHAVERMRPRHYLTASYYERMLTGVATLLVEKGVISRDELDARLGASFTLAGPVIDGSGAEGRASAAARFAVGDSVIVRDIHPRGHTRVPRYVRGKRGVVLFVAPSFSFPDAAAHGRRRVDEHTYHVRFAARELWPEQDEATPADSVVVDLWESYLEPV